MRGRSSKNPIRRRRGNDHTGFMRVWQLSVGGFDHNLSYLVTADGGEALLIDPTGSWDVIRTALAEAEVARLDHVFLTHGHADHVANIPEVKRLFPHVEVCGHPGNSVAERHLADGECLEAGGSTVEILYTPGHSRDSVCYLADRSALFTGDTLFIDSTGFARKPEGLYSSLKRIGKLPGSVTIYPGHDYGCVPFRKLEEEKRLNPYLACKTYDEFKIQLKELS